MKRFYFLLTLAAIVMLCCQCTTSKELRQAQKGAKSTQYVTLNNYFVRNDVNCKKMQRLVIDSKQEFDAYFGPAAIMGERPTDINWNEQFVIAVLLPETNKATMVTPLGVKQSPGNVIFRYQVNRGRKTSYTLVPFTAIALNRSTSSQQLQVFFIED